MTISNNVVSISVDFLEQGGTYEVDSYELTSEGLFIKEESKETKKVQKRKICEPLFVKETTQSLDNKDVKVILCYRFKENYHEIDIEMNQLMPNELLKLTLKGVDIPHHANRTISTFLQSQQKQAPHKEVYQQVGWFVNGKNGERDYVFRHHYLLDDVPNRNVVIDETKSNYNLNPKGSFEAWKNMIDCHVLGHTPLELAVCVGLSSVLVGHLSYDYDEVGTLLVHLAGDSTSGKTTAAMLAVSSLGLPSHKNNGLQKTWNGTKNALVNSFGGNYGIPVILDELSMSSVKTLTDIIYVLANGQEKSRLTQEIQQEKKAEWATTIISTGEQTLTERINQNTGLTVRLFELSNICWTISADNANAIRTTIQENYGLAGVRFIQYIFNQGTEIIDEAWLKWQKDCFEAIPDSNFRDRIAKKYAIILAAGDIANQALDLGLNLERILSFLTEHERQNMFKRDIGVKALQYVIQLVIQHQNNFRREGALNLSFDCWGKMFFYKDYVEVAFLKNILEQQLRAGSFDEPKVVIKHWKKNGYLLTELDRTTKRTKIFEDYEKEEREKALGKTNIPKKQFDTTYNIKIPIESLRDLVRS